jgi:hypothetical protein
VEVPLCERAAILFKKLALGRLKHLFARGKVIAEHSVELRCHPSRSVRIWERWLDIEAEVTGVRFEVPARLAHLPDLSQPDRRTLYATLSQPFKVVGESLDGEGQPPPEKNGRKS